MTKRIEIARSPFMPKQFAPGICERCRTVAAKYDDVSRVRTRCLHLRCRAEEEGELISEACRKRRLRVLAGQHKRKIIRKRNAERRAKKD